MTSKRVLITGLSTYWGGRLAQALEAHPEIEAIIGVDNRDPKRRARAHRVRARGQPARAAAPDRGGGRDRHGRGQPPGRRLDRHDSPRKAHENNVIGTMNLLAACSGPDSTRREVRVQVLGPLLRRRAGRPGLLHRGDGPPAPAAHAGSSATSSRPRPRWPTSPRRTRTSAVADPALRERARADRPTTSHSRLFVAARRADDPRLRPALPVRARGRRGGGARARGRRGRARHLQRGGRRRAGAHRGGRPARQDLRAGPAAVGHRRRGGALMRRLGVERAARDAPADALRPRRSTTAS